MNSSVMEYAGFLESHKVMLAPMAGVSDVAFRQLCAEQGASLAFTEMVSAKGLSYANERTAHLVDLYNGEDLVGVQIFGHEPATMADQARWIEQQLGSRLAVIDINMGCPVRKIAGKGDGAALMKNPALAASIVSSVAKAVQVPVSVKFRRGYYMDEETAPTFAKVAEEAGAAWVCVHGRYAQQMYTGASCSDAIARVKAAVSIPVVGNGDIRSAADALHMLQASGCDAVMVARAARGNPWIFAQIQAALVGQIAPAGPSYTQRIEMARRHAQLLNNYNPKTVVRMRKHASWYFSGIPGAAKARAAIQACTSYEDFAAVFARFSEYLNSNVAVEHA